MMTKPPVLAHVLELLENVASVELAEAWDNVGLMLGNPDQEVTGIMVAVDPSRTVLQEAMAAGINTIITHHPLIFKPLQSIHTDQPLGRFLAQAMRQEIAVIGCHTNLDQASGGVSDALAAALGLAGVRPLARMAADEGSGFGRIGEYTPPRSGRRFLQTVNAALGLVGIKVAGPLPEEVGKVAVCGGSGSDLAPAAFNAGAQIYVTGEVKHSTARWAQESGFCIADAGHYATERPVVTVLAAGLKNGLTELGWNVPVLVAEKESSPFVYYDHQGAPVPEPSGME